MSCAVGNVPEADGTPEQQGTGTADTSSEGSSSTGDGDGDGDGASNQPGTRLGKGDWDMSSSNRWQGADFEEPIELEADTTFWLVWDPPQNAQAPISTSGSSHTYKFSTNNGSTWQTENSGSHRWMLRIRCCE